MQIRAVQLGRLICGELLALRWRDFDLNAGTVSIQRTIGVVRNKGEGAQIVGKVPTTKRSRRVIDIDPGTVAVLRAYRKERGTLALTLVRDNALVFGDQEGRHRHPERFWRAFKSAQRECAKVLGDGAPPVIAIHNLRHTMPPCCWPTASRSRPSASAWATPASPSR